MPVKLMHSMPSKTASPVRILHRSDALAIAALGTVCVIFWRKQPTPTTFAVQKRCLDNLVKSYGSGVGVICVVEETSDPPSDELRRASSRMVVNHGTHLECIACVMEGAGFRPAITRAAMSGIVQLIRTPAPVKFFGTAPQAARWVAGVMRLAPIPQFVDTVESVRALIE